MSTWWVVLFVCCWGTILVLATAVLGLMRRVQQLETAASIAQAASVPKGPEVGAGLMPAPGLTTGPGIDSGGVLLFLTSSCRACVGLADALGSAGVGQRLEMGAITLVTDPAGEAAFGHLDFAQVIVQRDGEVVHALGIPATPYAIAVSSWGTVISAGLVPTLDALATLTEALGVEALNV